MNNMDNEREIAKLAALLAAGTITEDFLKEQIGDDSIVSDIVAMAATTAVIGAASGIVDDAVDTTMDVVDDLGLNPFKW